MITVELPELGTATHQEVPDTEIVLIAPLGVLGEWIMTDRSMTYESHERTLYNVWQMAAYAVSRQESEDTVVLHCQGDYGYLISHRVDKDYPLVAVFRLKPTVN